MIKLFEETKEPSLRDLDLPELPHGVEVPDDLSGMRGHEVVIHRRPVRWLRWTAAVLAVAAAGVALALVASDTVDGPSGAPNEREGPGTNSLNMTPVAVEIVGDEAMSDFDVWIATEGPGSHSLNLVTP